MKPPKLNQLSTELVAEFTSDNTVPIREWYVDDSVISVDHLYHISNIEYLRNMARHRQTNYYGETDGWLYQALDQFPIKNLNVLIVGSIMPWYESIVLEYGCHSCTVVEYRKQNMPVDGVTYIQPHELCGNTFDAVLSISSYEHDGLGRYGDPLNPNGDIVAMSDIRKYIKPNGLMFLAVPVGRDEIIWNVHRVYGRKRILQLIDGWNLVGKYGITDEIWDTPYTDNCPAQPVLVLRLPA